MLLKEKEMSGQEENHLLIALQLLAQVENSLFLYNRQRSEDGSTREAERSDSLRSGRESLNDLRTYIHNVAE